MKLIRFDNEGEYFNENLGAFFTQTSIIHQSTCVDTP